MVVHDCSCFLSSFPPLQFVNDIYISFSKASETRLRDQIAGLEETKVFLNKSLAVIPSLVPQAAKSVMLRDLQFTISRPTRL